jgi:3-phosphoshikimate 1-carboxyvinyltransferase
MKDFGGYVKYENGLYKVKLSNYSMESYFVEPDATSASYAVAAGVLLGGTFTIHGLGKNSKQVVIYFYFN